MKCTACQKELIKKETVFTEDKLPYCINAYTCNDDHPNSIPHILERQGAVKMFTEDELASVTFQSLNVSPEMKERIMKIATKPQSIRLSKLEIAHYLIELQEAKDFSSLSECIRYCVSETMKVHPIGEAPASIVPAIPVIEPTEEEPTPIEPKVELPYSVEEEKPEEEFTF
jgi:hypothetical protein